MAGYGLLADHFGIIIWVLLILDSGLMIKKHHAKVGWRVWGELILGVVGLLVDGALVFGTEAGLLRIVRG